MNKWLQNFACRANIGFEAFTLVLVLSMVLAFPAVSFQSRREALGNPINAIRYELGSYHM